MEPGVLKNIPRMAYSIHSCDVEYTDEFGDWWAGLSEKEQNDVAAITEMLDERGPMLPFPHSSQIKSSRHPHMR